MRDGFSIINWEMVIHLGINPVRGGRPPKDKIKNGSIILIKGEFFKIFEMFRLKDEDILLIIKKIGEMRSEYIIKYNRALKWLLIEIRASIQPIWVIEEYAMIERR